MVLCFNLLFLIFMNFKKISIKVCILTGFFLSVSVYAYQNQSNYRYKQTKGHVSYVHNAAELLKNKGEDAFKDFSDEGSEWFRQNRYLFVYDMSGKNIFHPVTPELKGKNLIDMKDISGKPIIRYFINTVTESKTDSGWVHYFWIEPGDIFPSWKSSYITKVTTPSKREYIIGSGLYNMRMEKQFIIDAVDSAVRLIKKKGTAAFNTFRDKSSRFVFCGTYIFVIDEKGNAIVDPAFPTESGRSLINLKDAIGKYVVREMIKKLKKQDTAWVMYMWPESGKTHPSKKLAYIRKVKIDDKIYIVGSTFFLANPIWMKL